MVLTEKWPVFGRHEQAARWLQVWSDLGRAPRTIDAHARGLSEYLLLCEPDEVEPLGATSFPRPLFRFRVSGPKGEPQPSATINVCRAPTWRWQVARQTAPPRQSFGVHQTPWLAALYASVLVWLAVMAGNIALFAIHPAKHWPILESIEALQGVSTVPVALILHRINRRSGLSVGITLIGLFAMVLGSIISVGFASELLTYGKGSLTMLAYGVGGVGWLVWLFAGNLLAWRMGTLPRSWAMIGVASAVTATLLYPIWALGLARLLKRHPDVIA